MLCYLSACVVKGRRNCGAYLRERTHAKSEFPSGNRLFLSSVVSARAFSPVLCPPSVPFYSPFLPSLSTHERFTSRVRDTRPPDTTASFINQRADRESRRDVVVLRIKMESPGRHDSIRVCRGLGMLTTLWCYRWNHNLHLGENWSILHEARVRRDDKPRYLRMHGCCLAYRVSRICFRLQISWIIRSLFFVNANSKLQPLFTNVESSTLNRILNEKRNKSRTT